MSIYFQTLTLSNADHLWLTKASTSLLWNMHGFQTQAGRVLEHRPFLPGLLLVERGSSTNVQVSDDGDRLCQLLLCVTSHFHLRLGVVDQTFLKKHSTARSTNLFSLKKIANSEATFFNHQKKGCCMRTCGI